MTAPTDKEEGKRKTPATICPRCCKVVRVRPCGGDWLNDIYPVRHTKPNGERCDGHFCAVKMKDIFGPGFRNKQPVKP